MESIGPVERVLKRLRVEEGWRSKPYTDTVGVWTVGYGFNLEALRMPREVGELWMKIIVDEIEERCKTFTFWDDLNETQQAALINMAYNLGWHGLNKFKRTLAYIEAGDYEAASAAILKSKAARQHAKWGNPRYEHIAEDIKG